MQNLCPHRPRLMATETPAILQVLFQMKLDLLHWNFTSHQFNAVDWCLAIQHGGTGRSAAPAEFMGGKGLRMKISLVLSLY